MKTKLLIEVDRCEPEHPLRCGSCPNIRNPTGRPAKCILFGRLGRITCSGWMRLPACLAAESATRAATKGGS